MAWDSTDTTWLKAADKRVKACAVNLVGYMLATGCLVYLLQHLFSQARPDPGVNVLRVLVYWTAALGLWLLVRAAWRWRQILRVVPQHEGVVCLKCVHPLDEMRTCPNCGLYFEIEKLQRYWSEVALEPQEAQVTHRHILWEFSSAHRNSAFHKRHRWTGFVYVLFVWLSFVAVFHAAHGGSFLGMMFDTIYFLGFCCAMLLANLGDRTEGDTLHCAGCRYQRSPDHDSPRCPECGAEWLRAGNMIKGRRVRHPGLIAAALGLMGLMLLLQVGSFSQRGRMRSALPTGSLIKEVVSDTDGKAEWAAISRRSLSTQEQRALSEAIVRKLDTGSFVGLHVRDWVVNQLMNGTFPKELERSWFERMISLDMHAEPEVRAGELFKVRISGGGLWFFNPNNGSLEGVIVEGFYVGDATDPIEQGTVVVPANELSRSKKPCQIEITHDEPGPLAIRFVYWTVIMPLTAPVDVVWREDGTPRIPAGTLWFKKYELRAQIEIKV